MPARRLEVTLLTRAEPRRDPHEVLGVDCAATGAQTQAAYRRLAPAHHPDRQPGDPAAQDRFEEIAAAYGRLVDGEARLARALDDDAGASPRTASRLGPALVAVVVFVGLPLMSR